MIDMTALLLSDTYKQTHDRMYPKGLTKLVSYWVPRKSMLKHTDKMIFFGLQAFIKEYLMDYFNKNFFGKPKEKVIEEYTKYMNVQIGSENYDILNDGGIIYVSIIFDREKRFICARYSTREKAEKVMQLLNETYETYSRIGSSGNGIGEYRHVFRFPKENEL